MIQAMVPSWLGVGATSHTMVIVSEHTPGGACAGCTHPVVEDAVEVIPTVSFVSFWAGFLLAMRFRLLAMGIAMPADQQVTTLWPLRFGGAVHSRQAAVGNCPLLQTLRGHPELPI
jgi:hypothetical protein